MLENYLGDDLAAAPRPEPTGSQAHQFAFFGQPAFEASMCCGPWLCCQASRFFNPPALTIFGAEQDDVLRLSSSPHP